MSQNSLGAIADLLGAEAVKIREIEKQAKSSLYDKNDEEAYRELMRQKALLLASLPELIVEIVPTLDIEAKNIIVERVDRFALSASQALKLGSVFFMSALLYPDDYKDGDKNDLELFSEKVRCM